MKRFVSVCSM